MWTDVLEDVNHLPLCEPVGPRHSVTEDDQAIDFIFSFTDRATVC